MIVEKKTIHDGYGGCNFCDRGVLSKTGLRLIYPYETVYELRNDKKSGLSARICDDCLQSLKKITDI